MGKVVLLKKGYSLEVTSWENDGDNYRTETVHIGESEEQARLLLQLCQELFSSQNNGHSLAIGNMCEGSEDDARNNIETYLANNKEIHKALETFLGNELPFDDNLMDSFLDAFVSEILGVSDFYICRVFDHGRILYAEKDITATVVERLHRYGRN